MKVIIVALALVAAVAAGTAPAEPIKILRSDFNQEENGQYTYGFDSDNGIHRDESGDLVKVVDADNVEHLVVYPRGSYSYVDENGNTNTIRYWNDEKGIHYEGDAIPK